MAIRRALRTLSHWLIRQGIGPSHRGTVQIVIAEVLNNVAEHAYRGTRAGPVTLLICICGAGLAVHVSDRGAPMPGGQLPDCSAPGGPGAEAMNEGGYGLLLIRTLTRDLCYTRNGTCNNLRFLLPLLGDPRE